ncbi:MAG: MW1434 family type I TA system toxin [Saprospiraceae bacterium]
MEKSNQKETAYFDIARAISLLDTGMAVARKGMAEKGQFIYKQIPQKVPIGVMPKMTSVPTFVKRIMEARNQTLNFIDGNFMIVNELGNTSYYTPSGQDLIAKDWCIYSTSY